MGLDCVNRRRFVSLLGGVLVAPRLAVSEPARIAASHPPDFSFLFITDAHLQPELNGVQGTALAMKLGSREKVDFAVQGGDHVFDAGAVPKARAVALYDQYGRTEQDLGLKVHHVLGNHDVLGIAPASGVDIRDPEYGKKMFAERFGPTWYSFDHKGCHFVVLDSIGLTPEGGYEARIDPGQIAWLTGDLAALKPGTPVVVSTHIPLVTAYDSYLPPNPKYPARAFVNGPEVIRLLAGYNVLGVLQGHTHVNEKVMWRGMPFITSGAVCGNWWHGPRMGTPEGYTVVTVAAGKLTTRYVATGFQTVAFEAS